MTPQRATAAAAVTVAAIVLVLYARHAAALLSYPWDWSPDEGLALDYARRIARGGPPLYARSTVPFPNIYTPLLPLLLAPFTPFSDQPLLLARVFACAWTAAAAAAVYALARAKAPPGLALVAAALLLAPFDVSFWYLLVRVDGLMLALFLWAAVALLPRELRRGGDALTPRRLAAGTALLLAAVLAKPTVVAQAAPLVLAWWWVDARSARRLSLALAAGGGLALAVLQAVTGGAFLWVMGLWGLHPRDHRLAALLVREFAVLAAPLLAWTLLSLLAARRSARSDASWLLAAGGLAVLPAMAKAGADWNYLLPFQAALVVLGARWWAARAAWGTALGAALALFLAVTREFPRPTAADAATARGFYGYLLARGGPILAARPDHAYYLLGQPVEMEGSDLRWLVSARASGTELLLQRLQRGEYRTVVFMALYWSRDERLLRALTDNYRTVGYCELGYYFGVMRFDLMAATHDLTLPVPPAGSRCRAWPTPSP